MLLLVERGWALLCVLILAIILLTACESAEGLPVADLSEEISGGNGPFLPSLAGSAAAPDGYVLHEYVAAGTATDYAAAELPDDGHWRFTPSTSAPYRTRVVVRRPADPDAASGTVILEWLNVSGGLDADPEYLSIAEEIVRNGHIWVGVSAQKIGVEGGSVLVPTGMANDLVGKGLTAIDPARYGSLAHPGDGYAFDIFTQVARALRSGGDVLGGVVPDVLIAAGESQSAMALTTYYDGVQPLTLAFDGFFVHSRARFALPLVAPGKSADIAGALFRRESPHFRDDLTAPVMDIQAEGDVVGLLNSSAVRQPDSTTFRLWEIAGTAHADQHLLGEGASAVECMAPINDGPMHLVAKAAFRALETWVRTGMAPVVAPRLELDTTGMTPVIARDADGIALSGLRTPPVDVPVDVLSGVVSEGESLFCSLLGSTTPLSDTRIAELHASRAEYEQRYSSSADATIEAGYVLDEDRAALIGYSQPLRVSP